MFLFLVCVTFGFELVNQTMFEMWGVDPPHISCHLPFEKDSLSKFKMVPLVEISQNVTNQFTITCDL